MGITSKDILQATNEDILFDLFEQIASQKTESNYALFAKQLSKPKRNFYTVWLTEMEVMNGGFNQLYFNGLVSMPIESDAFRAFGLDSLAVVVESANSIYLANQKKLLKDYSTPSSFINSSESELFKESDDLFYDICQEEDFYNVVLAYVRKHITYFIS